jgi:hypothetical protein
VYVFDHSSELVVGRPDNIGFSDASDYGEVLQHSVDDVAIDRPSIRIAQQRAVASPTTESALRRLRT